MNRVYTTPLLNPGDQLVIDAKLIFEGDPASIAIVPEPAAGLFVLLGTAVLGRRRCRT